MDNHPIPQDVTGFQFKLIGNMTVRQFAYLAAGSVLAYIFFILPIFILIKIPLSLFSFLFGLSLAFLPIEGRPLDIMFFYFLRALFIPNQYIFQKTGGQLFISLPSQKSQKIPQKSSSSKNLQAFLGRPKPFDLRPKNKLDEKETAYLNSVSSQTPPPVILEMKEEVKEEVREETQKDKEALEKEALLLTKELEEAKKEEVVQKASPDGSLMHQKVLELEKELSDTLSQKTQLENQLLMLQKRLDAQKKVYSPTTAVAPEETSHVRKIPKSMGRAVGAPIIPDMPNVVTGIIKDSRGNVLPNILVEVKDKEGNPVRAFKTNGLGQFASATPLTNGVYTIEFEDPRAAHKFDAIELSATGEIILPIEIISTDAREELRKELFNQT